MTSGNFSTIAISEIKIGARQRKEIKDVAILADSIRRLGLIHPIVLDRSHSLVAGERRLAACSSLDWKSISFQYTDDLDPSTLRAIELEENVKRANLTWDEEARAIADYHAYRCAEDSTWTQTRTAEELGYTQATISEKIATIAELYNPLVAGAKKYSVAKNIVKRLVERRAADVVQGIAPPTQDSPIIHADFHEWAKDYSGPPFNFIHCDFPYGIESHKSGQGAAGSLGAYDDSMSVYMACLDTLHNFSENISESAHMIFWFSMDHYQTTKEALWVDWTVDPFPLVWLKSDNTGILPDPQRGPRRIYETAFFCRRGDRKIIRAKANAFPAPSESSIHPHQKSVAMLQHFFEMVIDENTRLLDPTCGSGSAIVAARSCGAGSTVGLERDEEFARLAQRRLQGG